MTWNTIRRLLSKNLGPMIQALIIRFLRSYIESREDRDTDFIPTDQKPPKPKGK